MAPASLMSTRKPLTRMVVVRGGTIAMQSALALGLGWICKPADFGEFVTVVAYATTGATLAAGGALQGALRVAHLIVAESRWQHAMVRHLLASALRRALAGSVLTGALLGVNASVTWTGASAGAVLAMSMTLASASAGITIARGHAPTQQLSELCIRLPVQILGAVALMAVGWLSGTMLSLTTALASLCSGAFLVSALPTSRHDGRAIPARMARPLSRFITSASANATLFSLMASCDILLGSRVLPATAIAPLGIAGRISSSVGMLHGSIFDLHSSRIAIAIRDQDRREIVRRIRTVALESTALTLLVGTALAVAIFGAWGALPPIYKAAVPALAILMSARLVAGLAGPAPALLTLNGLHATLAGITIGAIVIEACLIYGVAATTGTSGLAAASAAGLVFYTACSAWLARRSYRHAPSCGTRPS